ncbi:hypothetical protein [uncultured Bifidobacterium sp.]
MTCHSSGRASAASAEERTMAMAWRSSMAWIR